MSEKGVTAGFKSAKKQGCKIVVIDLDEHVALPLFCKIVILVLKSVNSDPSKFDGAMKFSYICIVNRKW